MATGGPQKDQDLHDQALSVSPGKFKTEAEARAATDWNTKPAGGTTPYTLKGALHLMSESVTLPPPVVAGGVATQRMLDPINARQSEAGQGLVRAYWGRGGQFSIAAQEAEREARRAHDPASYR